MLEILSDESFQPLEEDEVLVLQINLNMFKKFNLKHQLKDKKLFKIILNILNNIAHQPEAKIIFKKHQSSMVMILKFEMKPKLKIVILVSSLFKGLNLLTMIISKCSFT